MDSSLIGQFIVGGTALIAIQFCGYFADNCSGRTFFIDFENEVEKSSTEDKFPKPKKEIEELYDFVDKKIKWTKTYDL